jgi:hypothetical protein
MGATIESNTKHESRRTDTAPVLRAVVKLCAALVPPRLRQV